MDDNTKDFSIENVPLEDGQGKIVEGGILYVYDKNREEIIEELKLAKCRFCGGVHLTGFKVCPVTGTDIDPENKRDYIDLRIRWYRTIVYSLRPKNCRQATSALTKYAEGIASLAREAITHEQGQALYNLFSDIRSWITRDLFVRDFRVRFPNERRYSTGGVKYEGGGVFSIKPPSRSGNSLLRRMKMKNGL